ncbi:MAG: hypothetical protein DMF90_23640, partial [Acidobacteria bacterium]
SGHRGTSLAGTFNEAHVVAIPQAICDYRRQAGTNGPLFIGKDTHALSQPAFETSLEVLAANAVDVLIDSADYTPTPVVSHAILTYNRGRTTGLADGIVITPSHNPPEDGGFKYNPSHGGPADTDVTRWIENAAKRLLSSSLEKVPRIAYERARRAPTTRTHDYVGGYVNDLNAVARVIAHDVVRGQREGVASLQLDSILRKGADAYLRSGQIRHDGDSPANRLRRRPYVFDGPQMIGEIAVREVESSDVHSRGNHLLENRGRTGGRTDRGHDFGSVKRKGHRSLLSAVAMRRARSGSL